MGKAFGECIPSKRWYIPSETLYVKGEICKCLEKKV